MIRINRQTDYAVRVLLALARLSAGVKVPTSQVTQEMLIPSPLARRLVADLARGGFVITYPGRDGCIRLARHVTEITLLQVVEFFEGLICITDCMTEHFPCSFEEQCPICRRWDWLNEAIRIELNRITFAGLASDVQALAEVGEAQSLPILTQSGEVYGRT